MGIYQKYHAIAGGVFKKEFVQKEGEAMNRIWEEFNKYAQEQGYTEKVTGKQYNGGLAWKKGNEVMELQ